MRRHRYAASFTLNESFRSKFNHFKKIFLGLLFFPALANAQPSSTASFASGARRDLACCCGAPLTRAPPVCIPGTFVYSVNGVVPAGEAAGVPISSLLPIIAANSGASTTLVATLCAAAAGREASCPPTHCHLFRRCNGTVLNAASLVTTGKTLLDLTAVVGNLTLVCAVQQSPPVCIIDGGGSVLLVAVSQGAITLSGLTLQARQRARSALPSLTRGCLQGGTAISRLLGSGKKLVGGAVFQTGGVIEAAGVTFASNTAAPDSNGFGGAVFQNGGSFNVTNANFTANTADVRRDVGKQSSRRLTARPCLSPGVRCTSRTDRSQPRALCSPPTPQPCACVKGSEFFSHTKKL